MAPFLSICVMTYRRKNTLVETLESLLGQLSGHPDVEVVVCDNASEDGTGELVKSYQACHPQLRYHANERNLGFDGNVVTCVQQGAGEYIAFFSDDDIAPDRHVEFLLRTLREKRPVVLYLNHRPFFHDDVKQLGEPASPQIDLDGDGGEDFLLTSGLGFISSLVVARPPALRLLGSVVDKAGEAHLDIASRIVLSRIGPCLYRGTYSVHARCDYGGAPILIGGCVNVAKLFRSLVREGLLSERANAEWLRNQVRYVLPRQVTIARGQGKNEYPLRGMLDLYGSVPFFNLLVLPLYLIPQPVMAVLYILGRRMIRTWRKLSWQGKFS